MFSVLSVSPWWNLQWAEFTTETQRTRRKFKPGHTFGHLMLVACHRSVVIWTSTRKRHDTCEDYLRDGLTAFAFVGMSGAGQRYCDNQRQSASRAGIAQRRVGHPVSGRP